MDRLTYADARGQISARATQGYDRVADANCSIRKALVVIGDQLALDRDDLWIGAVRVGLPDCDAARSSAWRSRRSNRSLAGRIR